MAGRLLAAALEYAVQGVFIVGGFPVLAPKVRRYFDPSMTAHLQPADAEVIRAVWSDAGHSHADLDLSTIIGICAAVVDRFEALAGSPPPACPAGKTSAQRLRGMSRASARTTPCRRASVPYPANVATQHRVLVPEHQQFSSLRLVAAQHQDSYAEYPARQRIDDLEQHPGQPTITASSLLAIAQVSHLNRLFERHRWTRYGFSMATVIRGLVAKFPIGTSMTREPAQDFSPPSCPGWSRVLIRRECRTSPGEPRRPFKPRQ